MKDVQGLIEDSAWINIHWATYNQSNDEVESDAWDYIHDEIYVIPVAPVVESIRRELKKDYDE